MSVLGPESNQDDVQSALRTVVDDYGAQALSSETVLGNLLSDLLPDNQREASLLVLAAKADVSTNVEQRIRDGMDPDTAVRLTASAMAESAPVAPDACMWVTNEIARALGHPVSVAAASLPTSQPTVPATAPNASPPAPPAPASFTGAATAAAPATGTSDPWSAGSSAPTSWPPPGPGHDQTGLEDDGWGSPDSPPLPPTATGPGPWQAGPSSGPPGGWGSGGSVPPPITPGPPPKRRSGAKVGAAVGAVVLLVVVYVIVAAVAKITPFSSSSPPTTTRPTPTTPAPTTPATTPSPSPSTQLTLTQLMPYSNQTFPNGIDLSTCDASLPFNGLTFQGLQSNLTCHDIPGEPGWSLYGFKFTSAAAYQAGLKQYNEPQYIDFDSSTAEQQCPPTSADGKGMTSWSDGAYPAQSGQVIECLPTLNAQNQSEPTYVWTLPSQHAFFELDAVPGVSFSTVDQWVTTNGDPGS